MNLASFPGRKTCISIVSGLAVALLGSCSTSPPAHGKASAQTVTPTEAEFNYGAGRGEELYVIVRMENGEKLLFGVDSGLAQTVLDESLAPGLGKKVKTRLTDFVMVSGWTRLHGYRAPKLYLGDVALATDKLVWTTDLAMLRKATGRPVMGLIGADCLSHYCAQFDFQTRRLRLLDPATEPLTNWGTGFPVVTVFGYRLMAIHGGLVGSTNDTVAIDLGDVTDGGLNNWAFRKAAKTQKLKPDKWKWPTRKEALSATFPKGSLGEQTYTNLTLHTEPALLLKALGLGFLARNLVTLDLPKGMLYLKQTSVGPLEFASTDPWNLLATLGWWATQPPGTNAASAQWLAERMLEPPNLRLGGPAAPFLGFYHVPFNNLPIKFREITNGTPPVVLSEAELAPADYHVHIMTQASGQTNAEGLKVMTFTWRVQTNFTQVVPLPEKGTIVMIHEYSRQKEYMLPWAYVLAQAGYRVILVDLRGHGQSTGQSVSFGKDETADLSRVLDDLAARGVAKGKVGVFSMGIGTTIALQWAARDPRVGPVVAVSPVNQLDAAFMKQAEGMRPAPSPDTVQQALALVAKRLGIQWADWSGEAALRQIREPVLFIRGDHDSLCSAGDLKNLQQAAPGDSQSIEVAGADRLRTAFFFQDLAAPVTNWFAAHLAR